MSVISEGITMIVLGLFGNIGVLVYAWVNKPEIFEANNVSMQFNTILGVMTYGELVNCVYLTSALGIFFIVTGFLFIIGKKKGWII